MRPSSSKSATEIFALSIFFFPSSIPKLYQNSCANARSETLILRRVLKQQVVPAEEGSRSFSRMSQKRPFLRQPLWVCGGQDESLRNEILDSIVISHAL